jgi:hypothetical protein
MTHAFTLASLAYKSTGELRSLFAQAHRDLAASDAGTQQRKTALQNVDTVSKALAARLLMTP